MNVGDLKEILEYLDDGIEIRVADQPIWPLGAAIEQLVTPDEWASREMGEDEIYEEEEGDREVDPDGHFLWIVLSDHSSYYESPYAPRKLWDNFQ